MFLVTGLGDRLKEARKKKGYTLDDLQSITKIQKRYLSGIENEDFGTMPGTFYVRAFIKQYAEAVGLDADEMLLLYKDSSGVIESEEEQKPSSTNLTRSSKRSPRTSNRLNEIIPKVIVALFIIVIIAVFYILMIKGESKKQQIDVGEPNPITVQDQQSPKDSKVPTADINDDDEKDNDDELDTEPDKNEQTLEHKQMNGEDSIYSLTGASEFKLEIRTSGESWIGVLDASKQERMPQPRGADTLAAGESVEIDVSDTQSVRIRVGRTASTEIYINGELLTYATDRVTQNVIIEYEKE